MTMDTAESHSLSAYHSFGMLGNNPANAINSVSSSAVTKEDLAAAFGLDMANISDVKEDKRIDGNLRIYFVHGMDYSIVKRIEQQLDDANITCLSQEGIDIQSPSYKHPHYILIQHQSRYEFISLVEANCEKKQAESASEFQSLPTISPMD